MSGPLPGELAVYADLDALAAAAADHIAARLAAALAARGRCAIGLSGGSTPRPVFERLAQDPLASRIDWPRVHVFWGDERCVPPEDPQSNYRMAREALLDHVPLRPEHVHRMVGELDPARAAAEYEDTLRAFFGPGADWPRFDLLLQGLGEDGHTASLFPGTAALHEQRRWVVANHVDKLAAWRITLTAPAINAAENILFLVVGESKAAALRAVLRGPYQPERFPAQLIQPRSGTLRWMADAAAAREL